MMSESGEVEIQQICALAAADLYGFDINKLAPVAARVGPTNAEIAVPLDLSALPPNAQTCQAFGNTALSRCSRWPDERRRVAMR